MRLHIRLDELALVQDLQCNYELGLLLPREVDVAKLASTEGLPDIKVVYGPLYRVELTLRLSPVQRLGCLANPLLRLGECDWNLKNAARLVVGMQTHLTIFLAKVLGRERGNLLVLVRLLRRWACLIWSLR